MTTDETLQIIDQYHIRIPEQANIKYLTYSIYKDLDQRTRESENKTFTKCLWFIDDLEKADWTIQPETIYRTDDGAMYLKDTDSNIDTYILPETYCPDTSIPNRDIYIHIKVLDGEELVQLHPLYL